MSRRMFVVILMIAAVSATVGSLFAAHHEATPRVFGLYTSDVQPGQGAAYAEIIEKEILPILKKHDVELIGAFTSGLGGSSNQMIFLMGCKDLAHIQTAHADPDLRKVQTEKFASMRVLHSRVLIPTSFSPLH